MDSGGMEWGDSEAMKVLIAEVGEGTERGTMIGNGADSVGRATGHHRVPTVKGQAIPAWDPRPLKATGVTYCTSAMGADHTAGLVVNPGAAEEDMPRLSQAQQLINAGVDASGFCMFLMLPLEKIREFYEAFFGEEISREKFLEMTWQCLVDEWEFNRRAGWKDGDDVMPDCMKTDGVGPTKIVYDVPSAIAEQTYTLLVEPTEEFFSGVAVG